MVEFITSLNPFDLLVGLVLFAFFVVGFVQGTIRRLLGIGAILFSFLVAANLREPLGNYLAANWTQFERSYAIMVGFGAVFVAGSIAFTLLIQGLYKKVVLFEKYAVIDEILGGLLGVVQGLLIIGITIVILDSHFELPGVPIRNELPFLRELHASYDTSGTASVMRTAIVPSFFAVLGPFVPDALRQLFPGAGGGTPNPV